MYRITLNGELLAVCDAPTFIKIDSNTGCYVQASKEEAEGIAVKSIPYSLPGHNLNDNPVADIQEVDGGILLMSDISENSDAIDNIIITMLGG